MFRIITIVLLWQSTLSIAQKKQEPTPSGIKDITLSEVIVRNENMYDIYKKAVYNLKKQMIYDEEITYKSEGMEYDEISGEERFLDVLFSAKLEKVNPKKSKLNYKFNLANLKHSTDILKSDIMRRNNYTSPLFRDEIKNELKRNNLNTIEFDDSLIHIRDTNKYPRITEYLICKEDTTLIAINIKIMPDKNENKYKHRWKDKSRRLSVSFFTKYAKNSDGYYLDYIKMEASRLFIIKRKNNKEELITNSYITKALPDKEVNTYTEFKPFTHRAYKMPNTEEIH